MANWSAGHLIEGLTPAFRPLLARSTLAAPRMTTGPVRIGRLLLRCAPRPRPAFQRSSAVAPRCLESVSTTDVHVTSTPGDTSFGAHSPSAVGNPPASDAQTAFPPRGLRPCSRSSSGAGPPFGHPASDGFALDGASPASGPPTASFRPAGGRASHACVREGRLPGFFGRRCLCRLEPSDTSVRRRIGIRTSRCAPVPPLDPASTGARQCACFHEIEVSSVARVRRRGPFELLRGAAAPAGRRGLLPHVFIVAG
jgi:hypothetical protein